MPKMSSWEMMFAFNNEYCSGKNCFCSSKCYSEGNIGRFNMVHAVVVDPSRFIKLTLWESSVSSVVAGSTYLFHNLTVLKDKFSIQHSLEQQ